jgi:hypothetical protein
MECRHRNPLLVVLHGALAQFAELFAVQNYLHP